MKRHLLLLLVCLSPAAFAQTKSGIMIPNRFGLSYQEKLGVDIGLISLNQIHDRSFLTFYDMSLGLEAFITEPFIVAPKINLDIGVGGAILLGGGVDLSYPTDFSKGTWMLTPKVGLSLISAIRIYYGWNIYAQNDMFPDLGKHRVSLEINLAALHHFYIGL